ncbi:ABC transporter permease [Cellulomonas sp. P5_C6]
MVLVAVGAMIIIPAVTSAASARVLADLNALGSNAWIVQPQPVVGAADASLPHGSLARASDLSGVLEAYLEVTTSAAVETSRADDAPHPVSVVGLDATPGGHAVDVVEGSYRPVPGFRFAVIGRRAADSLGLSSFPTVVMVTSEPVVVTGILVGDPLMPELQDAVVTDARTARALTPGSSTEKLLVRSDGALQPDRIASGIDPTGTSHLSVAQPSALVAARDRSSATLRTLAVAASSAAFGIAALGIAIMLTSSVRQRTAELAVRRVHGAPAHAIAGLVACEGLLLGVAGGITGLVVSNVVVHVVTRLRDWPNQLNTTLQALAFIAAIALCLAASLPPAFVALRVQPARAFAVE